jgi:hypothetical protein
MGHQIPPPQHQQLGYPALGMSMSTSLRDHIGAGGGAIPHHHHHLHHNKAPAVPSYIHPNPNPNPNPPVYPEGGYSAATMGGMLPPQYASSSTTSSNPYYPIAAGHSHSLQSHSLHSMRPPAVRHPTSSYAPQPVPVTPIAGTSTSISNSTRSTSSTSTGISGIPAGILSPKFSTDGTNIIMKLGVVDNLLGPIMGRSGNILKEIMGNSGTKILVSQKGAYIPGTNYREIIVEGLQYQVQLALNSIMQRISTSTSTSTANIT